MVTNGRQPSVRSLGRSTSHHGRRSSGARAAASWQSTRERAGIHHGGSADRAHVGRSGGFRFDLSSDRLQAFLPYNSLAPADYRLDADINRARQSERVLSQVLMLVYSLLSSEPMDGTRIVPVDKAWAETFVRQVDPSHLGGLAIVDIRFPDAEFEHDTRYLEDAATKASTYGADELTERLVLLSFEGELYDVGSTLLRYGGGWEIAGQSAPLAGTSALGTARPTTVEEYDRLTSGG